MYIPLFLSAVLIAIFVCFVEAKAGDVQEPATKHTFPASSGTFPKVLTLAGVGVRVKKIGPIKANVYAAALYVEKSALLASAKSIEASSAAMLSKSKAFENALLSGNYDRNIVLKMARCLMRIVQ